MLHRALHVLADEERRLGQIGVPPAYQLVIVSGLVAYLPVYLGHAVVHPSLTVPQQDVSIQVVVVLQAVRAAALRVALLVTVDAKGRDAHLDPRLHVVHGLVQLLDKEVDVLAPPVATVGNALVIGTVLGIVGNLHAWHRIGIEIVVNVQAVDVVAPHNVAHNLADVVPALRQGGVEQRQPVVLKRP